MNKRSRIQRVLLPVLAGALTLSAASGIAGSRDSAAAQEAPDDRPNFIVIVTDDQRADTMWAMPRVRRKIAHRGIRFRQGYVSNSLCCPSRASILTGRYSHSTGVYTNSPPHGGFAAFEDDSTIATWLDEAGYRTALVGKYFNGYADAEYIPPGWNVWNAFTGKRGNGGAFYHYALSVNGERRTFRSKPRDYSTDVLAKKALRFIETSDNPFFLYFAPYAPHGMQAAPRHQGMFEGLQIEHSPSYNEKNVSDKPRWVRKLDFVSDTGRWARVLETLLAVDEAAGRMVRTLREQGELDNTFIAFLSDHGRGRGEHRWLEKSDPYRGSTQIPYIVRYDRLIQNPRKDGHLLLNLDIAPTIARLAGVPSPGAEGASFVPLLQSPEASWRGDFLLEHLEDKRGVPSYCGVRTENHLYVAYDTDEEELYDLNKDPYELKNVAEDDAYRPHLDYLRRRVRELCSPPPPGYTFSSLP
ncbi:MAG: sulfatase [Actinomycetota bacterium]|nr:sulfatase [Actinomycetota bacterium]